MVCGIGFAAQFGCGLHISKVNVLDFGMLVFFGILLMVSDSLVLHFDTKFRFLVCFEAAKKTRNAKPFNVVVEFRLDLLWGPDW